MSIGSRIKQIRGKVSREDFARKIGADKSTIQRYENEDNIPKGDILRRIHERFGVDLNWLLTGRGEPYTIKEESGSFLKEPGSGKYYGITKYNMDITKEEQALINTLRKIGPEYARMFYFAAAEKARFLIEDGKLEKENKQELSKDLDTLATASIK